MFNFNKIASVIFILALIGASFSLSFAADVQPTVTAIEIKGLKRIEEGAIKTRLTQKIGEELSQEKTAEDIKIIYKSGYFNDVKAGIEPFEGGIKLIYAVEEKPTIVKVEFQGNKNIKDDELKDKIGLITGAISDITLINDNSLKLKAHYEDEGYYLAQIVPVVRSSDKGEVAVTFQIDEGEKVKIGSIMIEGNKYLSASQIKKAIKTSERGMFSFILGGGYYKRDEMRADIERIKDLYYNNGFLNISVAEPEVKVADDKKSMNVIIKVSEGDRYKISAVEITGNKVYTDDELRKLLKLMPPMIFSKDVLTKDIAAITDKYSNTGYALISVVPDLSPDAEKKETKITYRIEEGDKYTIGRIEISGNTKTRDKVIRREIRLDEGDFFNAAALKRSSERLRNLNYFETVDLQPKPKAEDKTVDLDINVKEKPTGFLSVGGGYSSVDRFIGMADITQDNIFGRGQYIKVRAELGGRSSFYELMFRDPWFMDKPISFGASLYRTTREYGNFDRRATGTDFSFGKNLGEYWGVSVGYGFEKATILNVKDDASQSIKDQAGTSTTSAVRLTITRDTRDNYIDPLKGSRNVLYLMYAGLGGSNHFIKEELDSSWFFPIFEKSTILLRGRIGHASGFSGKQVPLYERYYVGGIYTVRGLGFGQAGPKDINSEPIGGEKQLIFNAEYIFPISAELKFKGVVFADAGKAYNNSESFGQDLRYTTGFGIRWISPMGPLRVEWGYNLSKKSGESSSKLEFTFGTLF